MNRRASANRLIRKGRSPRTLRGRLSLVALTAATLVMVLLTLVFNAVAREHLRRQADDALRTRAAAAATTVDTGHVPVRVLETADDQLLDANVWIYDGARPLEQPPSPAPRLTRIAAHLAGPGGRRCVTASEPAGVRLCARTVARTGGAVTVVTALDLAPYRSSADTLLLGSLALDAVMLGCTYAVTRLAVGRALRPVHAMTEQAAQWSAVTSDARFSDAGHPAELDRLGGSLDALLDRIRALLRHERQLTGELSHELRTPLSRIVAEVDWLRSRPRSAAELRTGHAAIDAAAQSMRTICDTLLDEARATGSGGGTATGTSDTLETLSGLTQLTYAPAHLSLSVELVAARPPRAGISPALLERVVGPLLANALRHARTRVVVRVGGEPDRVRIDVTDDGPGVPAAFTGQLFRPGQRADPHDGHHGAGLGLPLARRLARSAGGDVTHDPDHAPGARFTVTLPPG
ncbi:sensor histidine kinase [Streptomyces sp. KL116D]|uniref:sensor histidine kinase n=1 Tax=Streptomyces sp. KL116D TaxID=3045152 RepID=UPI003557253B